MGKKIGVLAKNKKAQAPKDFQKETRKVGKKKQEASNATKTDFKVKQMQMPSQSALDDKGEEITQRRLGLQELLAHVGHHSAKVRQDAFDGLQELCTAHGHLLNTNLARILEATTTVAIDSSADVREAFRKFQAWLIEVLPPESLSAFASTLAIHVRSALSHVSVDVRTDGIILLELYAAGLSISEVLSQAEICRIMETLCQLTTQAEVVLQCLHRLLHLPRGSSSRMDCSISDDYFVSGVKLIPQLSLQSVLPARAINIASDSEQLQDAPKSEGSTQVDSPIWEFCLRAWLQAGDMPVGNAGGRSNSAASKPGRIRLRCAAVLERALEAAADGGSGFATTNSGMSFKPSASQVSTLVGLVKRGEWPIHVDRASGLLQLADSINIRMSYVLGLLISGAASEDVPNNHLVKIQCAILNFLDGFSSSASGIDGGVTSAAAALIDPRADVAVMQGAEGIAYAIRALALLWASSTSAIGAQRLDISGQRRYDIGPDFLKQLVSVTARFASGAGDETAMKRASTILATPLIASIVGIRLSSVAMPVPDALSPGWPEALLAVGEPCFVDLIEQTSPGSAVEWVSTWPKLLWYLGESISHETSGQAVSAYLLSLLLELAKLASRCGGVHEKIFAAVCPLLVPFFVGRPGVKGEVMPPVALLPRGATGAQGIASALLPHFPKMSDAFISALAQLVCRWSDVGLVADIARDSASGLGVDCCELILEVLLNGRSHGQVRPIRTRLSVALTILCSSPNRIGLSTEYVANSELAALRFVDYLAGWIMRSHPSSEDTALPTAVAVTYDDHRRLLLQTLAWPLCTQGLDLAPALTPRLLCFMFFCVVRLPSYTDTSTEVAASDLGWRPFLSHVFDRFLGDALNLETGVATAMCSSPMCDPVRGGFMGFLGAVAITGEGAGSQSLTTKRVGQLFVTIWMKVVARSQRTEAYELLIKLCSAKLSSFSEMARQEADRLSADSRQMASLFQIVAVMVAAISCRNELRLSTDRWISEGPQMLKAEIAKSLQHLDAAGHNLDDLRAMLPLL